MKLRIKGNSIRYRLTKTDVSRLRAEKYLEESTDFGDTTLLYSLRSKEGIQSMEASYINNNIKVFIPESFTENWPVNNVVGCDAHIPLPGNGSLYILVEKDFACLDETNEDQSDNYENPNKACAV